MQLERDLGRSRASATSNPNFLHKRKCLIAEHIYFSIFSMNIHNTQKRPNQDPSAEDAAAPPAKRPAISEQQVASKLRAAQDVSDRLDYKMAEETCTEVSRRCKMKCLTCNSSLWSLSFLTFSFFPYSQPRFFDRNQRNQTIQWTVSC